MRWWAAALARGAMLLRNPAPSHTRLTVARNLITLGCRNASPVRSYQARVTGHSQRLRWRGGSHLMSASLTAGPASQAAPLELQHDVDVLVEGTPLADKWRAVCTCVAVQFLKSQLTARALRWLPCSIACCSDAPTAQPMHPPAGLHLGQDNSPGLSCRASVEALEESLQADGVRAVHAALLLEAEERGDDKPSRASYQATARFNPAFARMFGIMWSRPAES